MLIKVTNFCSMGCSHCMEDSTVRGAHMPLDLFERALDCTARIEGLAWRRGIPPLVLLSGGECTEHPSIAQLVARVLARGWIPLLITNGAWLADPTLRASLLRPEWARLFVQVTHDPRFYPSAPPPRVDDRRVTYIDALTALIPLGRLARKKGPHPLPTKAAPSSFNFRLFVRGHGSIERAVYELRKRVIHCSPSISDDGTVVAGETRQCFAIGTVDSPTAALSKAAIEMRCNACGLVDNLSPAHRAAIGEP
ncbi:MAG: hypothetical protein Q8S73_33840 [Deltaproteobacteria bacterium]|nr:hypothetical protein [Deltaproteobacteria bacterium]